MKLNLAPGQKVVGSALLTWAINATTVGLSVGSLRDHLSPIWAILIGGALQIIHNVCVYYATPPDQQKAAAEASSALAPTPGGP